MAQPVEHNYHPYRPSECAKGDLLWDFRVRAVKIEDGPLGNWVVIATGMIEGKEHYRVTHNPMVGLDAIVRGRGSNIAGSQKRRLLLLRHFAEEMCEENPAMCICPTLPDPKGDPDIGSGHYHKCPVHTLSVNHLNKIIALG